MDSQGSGFPPNNDDNEEDDNLCQPDVDDSEHYKDFVQISSQRLWQGLCRQEKKNISSSPPFFTTPAKSLPGYNYGLEGKGKSKRTTRNERSLDVKGEMLFGLHPVYLALTTKRRKVFYNLYVNEKYGTGAKKGVPMLDRICQLSCENNIPLRLVRKEVLDLMAGNRPHQGVCLDTTDLDCPEWNKAIVPDCSHGPSLWLFLHNIQDPMNFGAILRSSYFMGVEKVIVPKENSCKLSPVVSKSSSGVLEVIDIMRLPHTTTEVEFCQWWKLQSGHVLGTQSCASDNDETNSTALRDFTMTRSSLLVLGNEGFGMSKDIASLCDVNLQIESCQISYHKEVDSLNVSVAAGILFHWLQTSKLKYSK